MPTEQLQALVMALVEPDEPDGDELEADGPEADVTRADVLPADLAPFDELGDGADDFEMEPTVYLIRSRVSTFDQLIAALSKP